MVFEEVTIREVGLTVPGPQGLVDGVIETRELHMDGGTESKLFAPAYGEFSTGAGGTLEALALAVPIDALDGAVPADAEALYDAALAVHDAVGSEDWGQARAALDDATAAWQALRSAGVPPLVTASIDAALASTTGTPLHPAVAQEDAGGAQDHALDLALAALDVHLRHQPVPNVDRARFGVWVRQLALDISRHETGLVAGDTATLEWIWDRVAHTVDADSAATIVAALDDLRAAADDEDLDAAGSAAQELTALVL